MRVGRLLVVGAVAAASLLSIAAAHASLVSKYWEVGPYYSCNDAGDYAVCLGAGQSEYSGSGGFGSHTGAGMQVYKSAAPQPVGVDAGQSEFGYFDDYRFTGIGVTAAPLDASAGVGQWSYSYTSRGIAERDTGVGARQGSTTVFVRQHVDVAANTCALQVSVSSLDPVEQPCPDGTVIPEIAQTPYMVPPGIEQHCYPDPAYCH